MHDRSAGVPSVSVIVPCYNVQQYVDRALESLRRQTFQDFEIVAIDDGSADQTHERLMQWTRRESRLRVFRQENKGLYLARLAGIAQATGEWVTFMDADDELEPEHLAGLVAGVDADVDVVVGGIKVIRLDGGEQCHGPRLGRCTGRQAAVELLTGHHSNGLFSCCNKIYRRTVLGVAKLERPRINYGEDQIFNLRVFRAMAGQVCGVTGATYRYIQREGSLMRSISERHIVDWAELWWERDLAARELLRDAYEEQAYRVRKMLNMMDFAGVVFRSESKDLLNHYIDVLLRMSIRPRVDVSDPAMVMRWFKWKLRLLFGARGSFPAWLR